MKLKKYIFTISYTTDIALIHQDFHFYVFFSDQDNQKNKSGWNWVRSSDQHLKQKLPITYFPFSKLSPLLSSLNSPDCPLSPNRETNTLASVPAPSLSPV